MHASRRDAGYARPLQRRPGPMPRGWVNPGPTARGSPQPNPPPSGRALQRASGPTPRNRAGGPTLSLSPRSHPRRLALHKTPGHGPGVGLPVSGLFHPLPLQLRHLERPRGARQEAPRFERPPPGPAAADGVVPPAQLDPDRVPQSFRELSRPGAVHARRHHRELGGVERAGRPRRGTPAPQLRAPPVPTPAAVAVPLPAAAAWGERPPRAPQ